MRDTVKTEEYFREMYNEDAYYLDKWMSEYQETISHPEKYDIASYKYTAFTYASKKFYSGYSLGLGMNELLPEVDLIIRNLIDTKRERDRGYFFLTGQNFWMTIRSYYKNRKCGIFTWIILYRQ